MKKYSPVLFALGALVVCGWAVNVFIWDKFDDSSHFFRLIAANLGDSQSQYQLGTECRVSVSGREYPESSIKMLTKAAEQNHVEAQYLLSRIHHFGFGVAKNYKLSTKWISKALPKIKGAAEKGNVEAQLKMAGIYYLGLGVDKNPREGLKWRRMAAGQGDADSQHTIGDIYCFGTDIPKDFEEGLKWHRKAANQGQKRSQVRLGEFYAYGEEGVKKDKVLAYMWFLLAAKAYGSGGRRLTNLESQMTPDEIAKGQKMAAEWRPIKQKD